MTIKEIREAKGLTQAELASAIGTTQAMISRWEKGVVRPGIDSLRKLADLACCSIDDITAAAKQLKMSDVLTREGYVALTAEERRRTLKIEQAKEYSGWRRFGTTCERLVDRIPSDWWDRYPAQHIGEVMALLKAAYDDGRQNPSADR